MPFVSIPSINTPTIKIINKVRLANERLSMVFVLRKENVTKVINDRTI